jgi:hypothetical protein
MQLNVLIHKLKAPQQIQSWLYSLEYNKSETMRTLRGVVKTKKAHCLEAVLAVATILEHHGYPPIVLDLESADLLGHNLFLYKKNGKFGTVGWSRDIGLNGRKPVYKTIRQLVQSYAAPYIDAKACITSYAVFDLRDLKRDDWRSSTKNVWYVEKTLRELPHQKLPLSKKFISDWRKKYLAFKKKHPKRQPTIYGQQPTWI